MIDADSLFKLLLYFVLFLAIVIFAGIVAFATEGKKNRRKKEQEMLNASRVDSLMKGSANKTKTIIEFDFVQKDDFDLGETRFFADTVDAPEDFEQPEDMFFVGQLDFGLLAQYDENNLLPKEGYLYIYCDDFEKEKDGNIPCRLCYSETKKIARQKTKVERDRLAFPRENCGIAGIKKNIEKFNEQYRWDDGSESLDFNHFFHANISKIFGYYTNCQKDEKEVLEISSKNIILLQLGDNVLADGVMTFLIKEEDLKNKKFERVVLTYSQS